MNKKRKIVPMQRQSHHQLFYLFVIVIAFGIVVSYLYGASKAAEVGAPTLKLGTYLPDIPPTDTPMPTAEPIPTVPITPGESVIVTPYIGGPKPPADFYCIDDEDADGCDDNTAFFVPKGVGGTDGSCGTVIEWAHKIVDSLPQFLKGRRDKLTPAVTSSCHTTGTYSSGYISTFFVIDAFNLAGFSELSKTDPTYVLGSNMLNWWQSSSAQSAGYTFIPYSPSVLEQYGSRQTDLTGCVMFLNLSSGVFAGIVNNLEVYNSHGDGVLSILQSGVSFYLDRFMVSGWDVQNTILHLPSQGESKVIQGVAGFGCHS